jgi:hypothetical protein
VLATTLQVNHVPYFKFGLCLLGPLTTSEGPRRNPSVCVNYVTGGLRSKSREEVATLTWKLKLNGS